MTSQENSIQTALKTQLNEIITLKSCIIKLINEQRGIFKLKNEDNYKHKG